MGGNGVGFVGCKRDTEGESKEDRYERRTVKLETYKDASWDGSGASLDSDGRKEREPNEREEERMPTVLSGGALVASGALSRAADADSRTLPSLVPPSGTSGTSSATITCPRESACADTQCRYSSGELKSETVLEELRDDASKC